MKVEFEQTDKKYIYIFIALAVFIVVSFTQYKSNSLLKEDIRKRDEANKEQKSDIENLLEVVDSLEMEKTEVVKRADSIEIKEIYYKNKYYATNKKLKDIISGYAGSSDEDKWDAFTNSLHE